MSQCDEINVSIDSFPTGEKSFLEIPFKVGPDIERIEVSYHFPFGGGGSVIDLGVAQNGMMRGWSGAERGFVTIEEDRATPGYDTGPLAGSWHAVLGLVKIGPACKLDLTIRLMPKRKRWLVGDLHSHSEHSDGGVTVLDAIHRARAARLDFVAITDHNAVSQNAIRPDDPGMLVIPGMELTSFWGHANLLGLSKPVSDWRCRNPTEVVDRMAEARANGATIIINHPFQNSAGGKWQAGFDGPFDALEIWNGLWTPMNAQAIAFWQELLVQGRRIPITGGSDFHLKNRRRHGHPANQLKVCGSSIADILDAVREGRTVVSYSPDALTARPVDHNHAGFGSKLAAGTPIAIEFAGLSNADTVCIVDENGCRETLSPESDCLTIERRFDGRFLRFEIWHGKDARLFTNPFFAE